MKRRDLVSALAVAAALAIGLAACAPASSAPGHATQAVSKEISNTPITLKVLDTFDNTTSAGPWFSWVVSQFEKKYPQVTVKRTSQGWGQVMSTVNLRLSDPNGPDIAAVNNGWQSTGTLVKGGRILNLDGYAALYGWKADWPQSVLTQEEFSTDGKSMGTGSLYAVPTPNSSLIGLYYNADMLHSLGLPVPASLDQLESDLAAVKAAGTTPMAYGAQDGGSAMLFGVQDLYGSSSKISKFVYSGGTVPVTDTGVVQAATTVKKWADNGWLTPSYPGVQGIDAANDFVNGKAAFTFYYTGSLPFVAATKHDFGYVQLPQADGSALVGTGAAGIQFAISAKSKHPDAAAAFLDFMASKQSEQKSVDLGQLPLLHSGLTIPTGDAEFATEIAAQQKLVKADGYVPYFDWSTPTMLNTAGSALQQLYAGQITPEQLGAVLQKDYDAFQSQRAQG